MLILECTKKVKRLIHGVGILFVATTFQDALLLEYETTKGTQYVDLSLKHLNPRHHISSQATSRVI